MQKAEALVASSTGGTDGTVQDPPGHISAFRWWAWDNHHKFEAGELERALYYLREVFETKGLFNAIFGFSQGSAMAVLVLALLEHPDLHAIWARPSDRPEVVWPPQPVRCAVLCSAFGPGDPIYQRWFRDRRVVHPLDTIKRLKSTEVHWHDGGHYIPRKTYWAALMRDFMLRHCDVQEAAQNTIVKLSLPTLTAGCEAEKVILFPRDLSCSLPEEDAEEAAV
ncbi:hypothetical protein JCM8202_003208 [Rhodotorula sphaerocarpa]